MDNGVQHYIFMYVYIHWISRLEYLKTFQLFCCLVVFLIFEDFCKLNTEQFLRVWENFAHPRVIRPSFFAPGQGMRQKKCPGGRD